MPEEMLTQYRSPTTNRIYGFNQPVSLEVAKRYAAIMDAKAEDKNRQEAFKKTSEERSRLKQELVPEVKPKSQTGPAAALRKKRSGSADSGSYDDVSAMYSAGNRVSKQFSDSLTRGALFDTPAGLINTAGWIHDIMDDYMKKASVKVEPLTGGEGSLKGITYQDEDDPDDNWGKYLRAVGDSISKYGLEKLPEYKGSSEAERWATDVIPNATGNLMGFVAESAMTGSVTTLARRIPGHLKWGIQVGKQIWATRKAKNIKQISEIKQVKHFKKTAIQGATILGPMFGLGESQAEIQAYDLEHGKGRFEQDKGALGVLLTRIAGAGKGYMETAWPTVRHLSRLNKRTNGEFLKRLQGLLRRSETAGTASKKAGRRGILATDLFQGFVDEYLADSLTQYGWDRFRKDYLELKNEVSLWKSLSSEDSLAEGAAGALFRGAIGVLARKRGWDRNRNPKEFAKKMAETDQGSPTPEGGVEKEVVGETVHTDNGQLASILKTEDAADGNWKGDKFQIWDPKKKRVLIVPRDSRLGQDLLLPKKINDDKTDLNQEISRKYDQLQAMEKAKKKDKDAIKKLQEGLDTDRKSLKEIEARIKKVHTFKAEPIYRSDGRHPAVSHMVGAKPDESAFNVYLKSVVVDMKENNERPIPLGEAGEDTSDAFEGGSPETGNQITFHNDKHEEHFRKDQEPRLGNLVDLLTQSPPEGIKAVNELESGGRRALGSQTTYGRLKAFGRKIAGVDSKNLPPRNALLARLTPKFPLLKNIFYQIPSEHTHTVRKTIEILSQITGPLNHNDISLLQRYTIVMDAVNSTERDSELTNIYYDLVDKSEYDGEFDETGQPSQDGTYGSKKEAREAMQIDKFTLENEINKNPRVKRALERLDGVRNALIHDMERYGAMAGVKVDIPSYDHYYWNRRHRIQTEPPGKQATKKRGVLPQQAGWEKPRDTGLAKINLNVLETIGLQFQQMQSQILDYKTTRIINDQVGITDAEYKALPNQPTERKDIDPNKIYKEDYEAVVADESHIHISGKPDGANVFIEALVPLIKGSALKMNEKDILKAIGGKPEMWVPKIVERSFSEMHGHDAARAKGYKVWEDFVRNWKRWQLLSPHRATLYNARNLAGDFDAILYGTDVKQKKAILGSIPWAAKQLRINLYTNKQPDETFENFLRHGGNNASMLSQELKSSPETLHSNPFEMEKIFAKIGNLSLKDMTPAKAIKAVYGAFPTYWKQVQKATEWREVLFRAAAYKANVERLGENAFGLPSSSRPGDFRGYGASSPEFIMAIGQEKFKNNSIFDFGLLEQSEKDEIISKRAFNLSNDLLGAYDRISRTGQFLREYAIPFWSFQEIQFKRMSRITRNAATNKKLAEAVGLGFLRDITSHATSRKSRLGEMLHAARTVPTRLLSLSSIGQLGSLALKMNAMQTAFLAFNNTFFPDEERDLPDEIKNSGHIILGKNDDGTIRYLNRLGTIPEFLEWFGLNIYPDHLASLIQDWMNGKKTMAEVGEEWVADYIRWPSTLNLKDFDDEKGFAQDVAIAGVDKLGASAVPFLKLAAEVYFRQTAQGREWGRSLPEGLIGEKRRELKPILNIWKHLFNHFAFGNEYSFFLNLPTRDKNIAEWFIYNSVDTNESDYFELNDLVKEWSKKHTDRSITVHRPDNSGRLLHAMKWHIRYGDIEAAKSHMIRYFNSEAPKVLEMARRSVDPIADPRSYMRKFNDLFKDKIQSSYESMNPLQQLRSEDRPRFLKSLTPKQLRIATNAWSYLGHRNDDLASFLGGEDLVKTWRAIVREQTSKETRLSY